MGLLFGGGPRGEAKKIMKQLEKTARRIQMRCPRCGRVHSATVYGSGRFSGRCPCGYNITDRDRY